MKSWLTVTVAAMSVAAGLVADRLILGAAVHAQETTRIRIGNESVYIGMQKDAALAKFAGKYGIGDLHDGRVLIMKSETEPKIVRTVGELTFDDGKLVSATRSWGDFWDGTDNEMEPLWNALRGAVTEQIGTKRVRVEIESSTQEEPNSHQERISIHFQKKDVEIGIRRVRVNNRNGTNFYVQETVF